jgi:prophage DNA circulation protein
MSEWTSRLRRASFRGVPFGVLSESAVVGRRQALHEFPGRDTPYAEDMGKATRRRTLQGFLVENSAIYGGGDVIAQRDRIEAAAEAYGPGALVHPTKGTLSISIEQLSISERWDQGRYFELNFEFVEAGAPAFSLGVLSTISAVLTAADGALLALSAAFGTGVGGLPAYGANTDAQAFGTALTTQATALGASATSAFHVTGDGVADAAASRVAITSAGTALQTSVARLNSSDASVSAVSQATAALIGSVCVSNDPATNMSLTSQFLGGGL